MEFGTNDCRSQSKDRKSPEVKKRLEQLAKVDKQLDASEIYKRLYLAAQRRAEFIKLREVKKTERRQIIERLALEREQVEVFKRPNRRDAVEQKHQELITQRLDRIINHNKKVDRQREKVSE